MESNVERVNPKDEFLALMHDGVKRLAALSTGIALHEYYLGYNSGVRSALETVDKFMLVMKKTREVIVQLLESFVAFIKADSNVSGIKEIDLLTKITKMLNMQEDAICDLTEGTTTIKSGISSQLDAKEKSQPERNDEFHKMFIDYGLFLQELINKYSVRRRPCPRSRKREGELL
jgi:hypothetical protein